MNLRTLLLGVSVFVATSGQAATIIVTSTEDTIAAGNRIGDRG
jgi:hypothetical protein